MPRTVKAIQMKEEGAKFEVADLERRDVAPKDVDIDIVGAGICQSDLHTAYNEWGGNTMYPLTPGHEIAGIVRAVGKDVTKFKVGDRVGVGCMVDSCRECKSCFEGDEQYCENGFTGTYSAKFTRKSHPEHGGITHGGYSQGIVVDEDFVVPFPDNLDLVKGAPLLCAGITTFSPLLHYGLRPNMTLGVAGLGGLGHMAVKFGVAFGAKVVVLSRGTAKKEDALRIGADQYVDSTDEEAMKKIKGSLNMLCDTICAQHDMSQFLSLLGKDGKLVLVGASPEPLPVPAFSLLGGRKSVAGSLIGGIQETADMLAFCGRKNILPETEVISADKVNEAYERMRKSDVKFRFSIDISTLK
ncbi:Cinnamyl alcohol dehydrogenase 7 [Hondaea fermentalgiana]|uniref:Cinnamyl alcohol dehydrogenase 7 n=1 Tax=Hondaea fermentalgiana TaxID=2315210 RepID=A0A2R5GPQ0_9STRA|nr:Cinnamyl alcohol dehydrogenase 7 [Hondaea fermentalgiana]|eukprot:GBG32856.1 Cinnamyl alcohol dehydrogenase 7 [Hondaea fermentalgiana]